MIRTDDILVLCPEVDIHSVEHSQEWEPPGDACNDGTMAVLRELVYNCAEQEEVNDRPESSLSVRPTVFLQRDRSRTNQI